MYGGSFVPVHHGGVYLYTSLVAPKVKKIHPKNRFPPRFNDRKLLMRMQYIRSIYMHAQAANNQHAWGVNLLLLLATLILLLLLCDIFYTIRSCLTFCLLNPGSTTYTMPSIVSDVSAMLVDTMTFLPGGCPGARAAGASLNISCCCLGGSEEYKGYTTIGPVVLGSKLDVSKRILYTPWHCS
jgi:hypothetical protein